MKDVKQIVIEYLKANNFDGLCDADCGCGLDDLFPCNGANDSLLSCIPAKRKWYTKTEDCGCMCSGEDHWHYDPPSGAEPIPTGSVKAE